MGPRTSKILIFALASALVFSFIIIPGVAQSYSSSWSAALPSASTTFSTPYYIAGSSTGSYSQLGVSCAILGFDNDYWNAPSGRQYEIVDTVVCICADILPQYRSNPWNSINCIGINVVGTVNPSYSDVTADNGFAVNMTAASGSGVISVTTDMIGIALTGAPEYIGAGLAIAQAASDILSVLGLSTPWSGSLNPYQYTWGAASLAESGQPTIMGTCGQDMHWELTRGVSEWQTQYQVFLVVSNYSYRPPVTLETLSVTLTLDVYVPQPPPPPPPPGHGHGPHPEFLAGDGSAFVSQDLLKMDKLVNWGISIVIQHASSTGAVVSTRK